MFVWGDRVPELVGDSPHSLYATTELPWEVSGYLDGFVSERLGKPEAEICMITSFKSHIDFGETCASACWRKKNTFKVTLGYFSLPDIKLLVAVFKGSFDKTITYRSSNLLIHIVWGDRSNAYHTFCSAYNIQDPGCLGITRFILWAGKVACWEGLLYIVIREWGETLQRIHGWICLH